MDQFRFGLAIPPAWGESILDRGFSASFAACEKVFSAVAMSAGGGQVSWRTGKDRRPCSLCRLMCRAPRFSDRHSSQRIAVARRAAGKMVDQTSSDSVEEVVQKKARQRVSKPWEPPGG